MQFLFDDGLFDFGIMPAPPLMCECGDDFGLYMQRCIGAAFPWNPMSAAARDVSNVWVGRRIQIMPEAGADWLNARVVKFRQWNTGPFSDKLNWDIMIEYDDDVGASSHLLNLESIRPDGGERRPAPLQCPQRENAVRVADGDISFTHERRFDGETAQERLDDLEAREYRDLQRTAKAAGLPATGAKAMLIVRLLYSWLAEAESCWDEEDQAEWEAAAPDREAETRSASRNAALVRRESGRRDRSPSPAPRQTATDTEPPPLVPSEPVAYRIVRASINEGGTLSDNRVGRCGRLISFKWAEPAVPDLDVREGLSCPICRAIEPPSARAGELRGPDKLCNGECPVCFCMSNQCIRLECSHVVCQPCWRSWRRQQERQQEERGPESEEDEEADEAEEIDWVNTEWIETERAREQGEVATSNYIRDTLNSLLAESERGSLAATSRLKRKLLVLPITGCMSDSVRHTVERHGSIDMLETYVEIFPLREQVSLQVIQISIKFPISKVPRL
jgi:hypothetical protein